MTISGILLIDVLSILPEELELYIQAPSLEDHVIQSMMNKTEYEYYKVIRFNIENRSEIINRIEHHFVGEYFQNIQIKVEDGLLFEGYDGIEFGIISKSINIPLWFKEEYVLTGLCRVSDEW